MDEKRLKKMAGEAAGPWAIRSLARLARRTDAVRASFQVLCAMLRDGRPRRARPSFIPQTGAIVLLIPSYRASPNPAIDLSQACVKQPVQIGPEEDRIVGGVMTQPPVPPREMGGVESTFGRWTGNGTYGPAKPDQVIP